MHFPYSLSMSYKFFVWTYRNIKKYYQMILLRGIKNVYEFDKMRILIITAKRKLCKYINVFLVVHRGKKTIYIESLIK